jgi:RNA polymerase sigma-70 factor (family 1)
MNEADKEFKEIYLRYFAPLFRFAQEYLYSEEDAQNIVQDLFTMLWERKEFSKIENHSAFLYRSVKNKCIDLLRHRIVAQKNEMQYRLSLDALEEMNLDEEESPEDIMNRKIALLPPKCREIFILSKIKGKRHKEISSMLNISISTIENQMAIAMKKLSSEK